MIVLNHFINFLQNFFGLSWYFKISSNLNSNQENFSWTLRYFSRYQKTFLNISRFSSTFTWNLNEIDWHFSIFSQFFLDKRSSWFSLELSWTLSCYFLCSFLENISPFVVISNEFLKKTVFVFFLFIYLNFDKFDFFKCFRVFFFESRLLFSLSSQIFSNFHEMFFNFNTENKPK